MTPRFTFRHFRHRVSNEYEFVSVDLFALHLFPKILILILVCLAANVTCAGEPARKGVVVSVSGPASDVGAAVLRDGGNAVDAAVATAFSLAVAYPEAGNIGGGGYMLVHPGGGIRPVAFDFRETASAAATRDMFIKPEQRTAHRRVGVPGTVAGLALAHQRLGKLPWSRLVEPAVKLAAEGFELDDAVAKSLNAAVLAADEPKLTEFRRVFAKPDGTTWQTHDTLLQPELAKTLRRVAQDGPRGFYSGATAELIAAEMQRGGGLITKADLANYRALERTPLHGTYRGFDVWCMPPSSSGGTTLLEALNILENFDLRAGGRWSPRTLHLMIEASRRAYRDRACHLGDPDFVQIPEKLLQKPYAKELAAGINLERATPSSELAGEISLNAEGEQTTHLSVVDGDGTAVSLTFTLESSYGSRVVVTGGGFLLNDEMNDFGWLPGVTNASGRIGTPPNLVAPGKRMLSSMCPTIVARDGKARLVTGSPGGRTIINTVLNIVVNFVDFEMDPREAIDAPRIHHQWFPDRVRIEPALAELHPQLLLDLGKLNHQFDKPARQGDAHTIWIDPVTGDTLGLPDHRISGKASSP